MFPNRNWLIKSTKPKLTDLYLNEWKNEIEINTSCVIYRMFKSKFEFEKYLTKTPAKLQNFFIRFRTRNYKLPIEVGRWRRIPRENRKCHLCNLDIGDEYHYLLVCEKLENVRKQYIHSRYFRRPNSLKFSSLLNVCDPSALRKLCLFIKFIIENV